MCPREYRLGKRATVIEENRGAILDVAGRLFVDVGFHRTSVEEVARLADVAAATVYYQFGSKAGLLQALSADVQQRAGRHLLDPLLHGPDPVEVARAYVRESCRLWGVEPGLFRMFNALAAADPAVRPLLADGGEIHRRQAQTLARRLAERDQLCGTLDALHTAAVLRTLTSFETFDQVSACGDLTTEGTAELILALVAGAIPAVQSVDR
jgi:AcrR family transcriptional regulator